MSKMDSIKLLFTKKSENIAQKFQQPSSTLPRKYKFLTLHQSSMPHPEPTLSFPANCLLFLKQILHFKLLIHILYCPLSPKYPYSFICLKKFHLLFFRLISKTTFCIKSLQCPHIPMTFHGTILICFMRYSLFCFVMQLFENLL